MSALLPIPEDLWATVPPAARAALLAAFAALHQQLDALRAEVADLRARLGQDSSNSHRPPSADPPHAKPAPPRQRSGRRPGGQPGPPRCERVRLPAADIRAARPTHCGGGGGRLGGTDPDPDWHQVWELPPIRPHVTEYRRHALRCPDCGTTTAAAWPAGLAAGGYGPGLKAAVVYLTGHLHLSKAEAQDLCADLLGVPLSTGQVGALEAEAVAVLEPAVAALRPALPGRPANVDETGWKPAGRACWLWVAVTTSFSVFTSAFARGRRVVDELLGPAYAQVATTDRWGAYRRVRRRQLCWAHLRRDFQAMIDADGGGARVGGWLLGIAADLLGAWRRVRDGTLSRATFRRYLRPWRAGMKAARTRGRRCRGARTAATCRELLGLWEHLWTFAAADGVEPTNNAAERALRPAVLWRKKSQGTRSASGSRYVAALLSVAATCRQQGRQLWA